MYSLGSICPFVLGGSHNLDVSLGIFSSAQVFMHEKGVVWQAAPGLFQLIIIKCLHGIPFKKKKRRGGEMNLTV